MDRDLRDLFIGVALLMVTIFSCGFGIGIAVDYWNGSAKAAIIERQTGVKYTWREAAQFKTIYDAQNVRVIIEQKGE